MRKVILSFITMVAVFTANAQINCQPGKLSQLVNDNTVTTLTVTGQMDARDFRFIASSLNNLTTLDLSEVEIVAFEDLANSTLGNEHSFAAGVLPTLSLAGKQQLTTLVLPTSLQGIGAAAIAACPALKQVTMGNELTTVGEYAFTTCTGLETITLPASVTTVGEGAFARCHSLTSFTISNNGTQAQALTLGNEAFLDCPALTQVQLGANLTSIGNSTFTGTGLTTLDLSKCTKLQHVGDWAYYLSNVTSATFPAQLNDLGKGAFLYSERLVQATLPAALETLPNYTFAGSTVLDTVNLAGVKHIGDYALYNATQINYLTLPASVQSIGNHAMAGMTGLKLINTQAIQVPSLGNEVWAGVDQANVRLIVPNGHGKPYTEAEQWKEFMVSYIALLGDADEDMVLSVGDINILVNVILGTRADYPPQADTNQDGTIGVEDINYVINRILGGASESYIFISPNTTDEVAITNFTIKPGETIEVALELNNNELCSHLQCDINLPQGLSIVGMRTADRAAHHNLLNSQQDGIHRIICYTTGNQRIEGNSGAVITLRIAADQSLASEATIDINNIVLADATHPTLYAAPSQTNVSNTTGIDDMTATTCKVYAAGNVLVIETLEAGTAQLVAMNGSAQQLNLAAGRNEFTPGNGIYVVRTGGISHKVAVK